MCSPCCQNCAWIFFLLLFMETTSWNCIVTKCVQQMEHNIVAVLSLFYAAVVQVPTIVFSLIGLQSSSFFLCFFLSVVLLAKIVLPQVSIKAPNPCNFTNHRMRVTKIALTCLDNNQMCEWTLFAFCKMISRLHCNRY